jgi:hypothetical protein
MGMLITVTGLLTTVKDEMIFLDAKQNDILIKCIYTQVCLYHGATLHFNVLFDA